MHEQVFLNLIEKYQDSGQSLDRILKDPAFKDIPLAERVELLKKYAHVIREGSKADSQYWKDLALGSAGVAVAAGIAANPFANQVKHFINLGEASARGEEYTGPKPNVAIGAWSMLAMTGSLRAGIGKFNEATSSYQTRKLVKSYLKPEEGATTTRDAIDVLTRSQ